MYKATLSSLFLAQLQSPPRVIFEEAVEELEEISEIDEELAWQTDNDDEPEDGVEKHQGRTASSDSDETPVYPADAPSRQEILWPKLRGTLMSGWRGWRTGSQPCTPATEEPPMLAAAAAPASPKIKIPAMDYFGAAAPAQLEVRPDPQAQAQLPKLSPEFVFGRRTPSPVSGEPFAVTVNGILHETTLPPFGRRLRAASADQLNLTEHQREAAQRITTNSNSTATATATTTQEQRHLHRKNLSHRLTSSVGPRMQGQSFDAASLQKLRQSANGTPRYDWI